MIQYIFFTLLVFSSFQDYYSYSTQLQAYSTALGSLKVGESTPDEVETAFNNFANSHYSFSYDPKYSEHFGTDLSISTEDSDNFEHVSLHSFCVGFTTTRKTYSYVEYGESSGTYSSQTSESERHLFYHLHHITNLDPSTTYYYRLVVRDEETDVIVRSVEKTVTTLTNGDPSHVYISQSDIPIYISGNDKHVILLEDLYSIDCNENAAVMVVEAIGVIVDLNGHTIRHGRTNSDVGECHGVYYISKGTSKYDYRTGMIVNGVIEHIEDDVNVVSFHGNQIAQRYSDANIKIRNSYENKRASNLTELDIVVAAVRMNFWFDEAWTHYYYYPQYKAIIKFNQYNDRGTVINNRHQGVSCVGTTTDYDISYSEFHHNVVLRYRHWTIRGIGIVYKNEIYVDSFGTNSFGVSPVHTGARIYENKFYLTGFHTCGLGWGTFDMKVYNNFFHLEAVDSGNPSARSGEYTGDSVNAVRLTQYGEGGVVRKSLHYDGNVIIGYYNAGAGGILRGYQICTDYSLQDYSVTNTYVRVLSRYNVSGFHGNYAVVTHGARTVPYTDINPLYYRDSVFIGDTVLIQHGDSYSSGHRHFFFNVTFRRIGDHKSFHTHYISRQGEDHRFIDCLFENSKHNDVVNKFSYPTASFGVFYSITVVSRKGDSIYVKNSSGKKVCKGSVDSKGIFVCVVRVFRAVVPDVGAWGLDKFDHNPFYIKSKATGKSTNTTITSPICLVYYGSGDCPKFTFEDYLDLLKEKEKLDNTLLVIFISISSSIFVGLVFIAVVLLVIYFGLRMNEKKNVLVKSEIDMQVDCKVGLGNEQLTSASDSKD